MSPTPANHSGLIAAAIAACLATPASAADYYAGKTVDIVVGNYPGGGFDIYARALGRHLGRNIPGNPTVVVKNMPGAGSAKAGHHISTVAPKDGLSIGAVTPGAVIGPLLDDRPETIFDPMKVLYLGTANSGARICATYASSKTKTFDEALARKTILGGVAAGDAVHDYAYLIKRTTAAQVDVVAGYKGTLDLALAMERGEIDGVCGWDWSSAKSQKPEWVRDGKLNILAQLGPGGNDELSGRGVPQIWTYMKNDEARKVAEMVVSQQAFTRPYFIAMGTPADLVSTLRTAFDATMRDPQFLADAEKMHIDISPLPGARVQELVGKLYATPAAIVESARGDQAVAEICSQDGGVTERRAVTRCRPCGDDLVCRATSMDGACSTLRRS
jgi:tripartite-type tricarboxylate transporter receptor subunit TctC